MILADANLLLYAYNASAPEHASAKAWLERSLSRPAPLAFCWQTIGAFLRLTTNRAVFPAPLSIQHATRIVDSWLERPMVVLLEPGPRHWAIAREVLEDSQARGSLVPDALLAALAIEHGAIIATHDADFRRFPQVSTVDPLAS